MSYLNFTDLVRVYALLFSERLADTVRRVFTKCRDVEQRFLHLLYGKYMAKLNIFYESSAKSIVFFWKKAENVLKTQDINSYDKPPPHPFPFLCEREAGEKGQVSSPSSYGGEWMALLTMCHSPLQRGEEGGAVYLGAGGQGTETQAYYLDTPALSLP